MDEVLGTESQYVMSIKSSVLGYTGEYTIIMEARFYNIAIAFNGAYETFSVTIEDPCESATFTLNPETMLTSLSVFY